MNTLAIDCSTEILGLTLESGNKQVSITRKEGLKHSENLMTGIDWLFSEMNLKKKELDLIVCSMGPGSFTGLRIGVATAKALALGCEASWVLLSNLDTYGSKFSFFDGLVVPVIDARKQRFYTAFYRKGQLLDDYKDICRDEIFQLLKDEKILFTGPHCQMLKDDNPLENVLWDNNGNEGISTLLLELGKEKYSKSGGDSLDLGPLYLRKSEAEIASGL